MIPLCTVQVAVCGTSVSLLVLRTMYVKLTTSPLSLVSVTLWKPMG